MGAFGGQEQAGRQTLSGARPHPFLATTVAAVGDGDPLCAGHCATPVSRATITILEAANFIEHLLCAIPCSEAFILPPSEVVPF